MFVFQTAHRRRNNSVVVDNFQGQYKSTVVCPTCAKGVCHAFCVSRVAFSLSPRYGFTDVLLCMCIVAAAALLAVSVTFDPYMYVSLPLPTSAGRYVEVAVKTRADPVPILYGLELGSSSTMGDVKEALADACGIAPHLLWLTEVHNCHVFKEFTDHKHLSDVRAKDRLFAFETLPRPVTLIKVDQLRISNNFQPLSPAKAKKAPPLPVGVCFLPWCASLPDERGAAVCAGDYTSHDSATSTTSTRGGN